MSDLLSIMADVCDLPDGSIPTEAVLIVSFIGEDGNPAFRMATGGDDAGTVATLVGLLEMAKFNLMSDANPCPCESEEDDL